MPLRPPLPADDLYGRLGVPTDASVEAIEVAWRALLRRHHPDVAGDDGLELAKRINVAHDWLSDTTLRARYDRERGVRGRPGPRASDHAAWHPRAAPGEAAGEATAPPTPPRRPAPPSAIERFLDRVANLTATEIDRLGLSEPPPIAFGATIRRFLPAERAAALDAITRSVAARLPTTADTPRIHDAIDGYATELVLGPFLDRLLSEPFRDRARERLTRGWEAAIGQPRYGPNTRAVVALLERMAGLDPDAMSRLAGTGTRARLGPEPWPGGLDPDDDETFRVSSLLAQRDALAAVDGGRAGQAAARLAHLLVLRHAFTSSAFAEMTAPWRPWLLAPDVAPPPVRRPRDG